MANTANYCTLNYGARTGFWRTLFEWANLTPIPDKHTLKTIHKLRNDIKENAKSIYSNLGGETHGHRFLVLTNAQYVLISPTPFVYPTQLCLLIIPDGTTSHTNSNMRIAHT